MPDSFDAELNSVYKPLWYVGWQPLITIVVATGIGLYFGSRVDQMMSLGTLGFAGGAALWFYGTRHVNEYYQSLLDAFRDDVRGRSRELLGMGGNVETFMLESRHGSSLLVTPSQRYEFTTLIVGETSLAIQNDAQLKMSTLDEHIGTSTNEVYFDQISSVNYDRPHLEVKTSEGSLLQYRSSREPNDAMHEIQNRIREYKRVKA